MNSTDRKSNPQSSRYGHIPVPLRHDGLFIFMIITITIYWDNTNSQTIIILPPSVITKPQLLPTDKHKRL